MSDTPARPAPGTPADEPAEARRAAARSVRGYLALFTVALVGPVLLFAAFVLWQFAATERNRLESEAVDLAQTIAVSLDRDLTGITAALDVLSTSSYLRTGDFEGLHNQAAELLRRQGIVTILTDLEGQQLVNVRLPWGSPLPRTRVGYEAENLEEGRPYVTDQIVGQVTGTRQFVVVTLVRPAPGKTYRLLFSFPLARLQRILQDADIGSSYTASIVDRKGIILARSSRAEEFVGRAATPDLQRNTVGRQGTWSGTTVDGTSVFGAYSRSRLSDFRAAVGIRYADLNAPLWRSLSLFSALGLAITALSLLLGLMLGRRITTPIAALGREAARLGRGEPVAALATALLEANQVGKVLADASAHQREREADLREANDEIQRFAYIVSHDLRSPLVNIMGFTTELEALREDLFRRLAELRAAAAAIDGAKDDELGRDFDEAVGFIKASISKMDRLINAILRLSREGRRAFNPEPVDMNALVAGIKASLTIQAEAADATVSATALPDLVSDRLALEQIFTNLIDNALKYLRRGVPGEVVIEGRARGGSMVYAVRDNGRGIDPRDAERVFDLFRRSGVQDRPGEGIGLAHVRALVRRLGGTIVLTSAPGQGSTFVVTLPRRWVGEMQKEAA